MPSNNKNQSQNQNPNNMNIFESFTVYIAKYIDSLSLWKKELQMILISLYISLSCITTVIDHVIHFNTTYPMKLVDIVIFFVMFVLLLVNVAFIYGCFTKNRILLFLTPAIPNLILIYVFFPTFHAFFLPLNAFLKVSGLEKSLFASIINNLGNLTLVRAIYFIPIIIYCRFLFNNYTDEFIECLEEIKEIEKEEAEKAKTAAEEQQKQDETTEETNNNDINENENTTTDQEAKKNN